MKAAVRIRDVTKVFALGESGGAPVSLLEALRAGKREVKTREVCALDGISFSIVEGERVGIIGPNGAGKTTLLSILARLTEPTSGTVEVDGEIHAMLTIGAVLREDMTGRENIYLDASVHGRSKAEIDAVADKIIAFSELGEFIDRPVRTYSSGMKARVAFSMGAFIDPDILIIDETLSVGDAFFAEKASRRMKEIAAAGRIVIVVSHGLGTIVSMCTRCIWIDRGRIVMDGDPATVTKAYDAHVRDGDEQELMRKFGLSREGSAGDRATAIEAIELTQAGAAQRGTLAAMVPLEIVVRGRQAKAQELTDLTLSFTRVDGRLMWRQKMSQAGVAPPPGPTFCVRVAMSPFMLGADLYRLDAVLAAADGSTHRMARVVEVVDQQGQYGGKPLIYHSPVIAAQPAKGTEG